MVQSVSLTNIMEKKSFISFVAKAFIFSTLLTIFVTFYMKDQLLDFFKGRTVTSSKFIEVLEYEIPTTIFCMDPGTKPTVAKKHNLKSVFEVFALNETFSQVFEEISYILNVDFDIFVMDKPLSLGNNIIQTGEFDLDVNLEMIRTFHHGTCYKMESSHKFNESSFHLPFEVILNVAEDVPGLYLKIPSNKIPSLKIPSGPSGRKLQCQAKICKVEHEIPVIKLSTGTKSPLSIYLRVRNLIDQNTFKIPSLPSLKAFLVQNS